jgi:hypothetical protein
MVEERLVAAVPPLPQAQPVDAALVLRLQAVAYRRSPPRRQVPR